MSPISDGMSNALDALKAKITAAEEGLRRLPGGEGAEYCYDDCPHENYSDHICFRNGVIQRFRYLYSHDVEDQTAAIMDLPVAQRVAMAAHIPALIDAAVAREKDVLGAAERACDDIEQRLSQL